MPDPAPAWFLRDLRLSDPTALAAARDAATAPPISAPRWLGSAGLDAPHRHRFG